MNATMAWLAGLISTDGSVFKNQKGRTEVVVATVELPWAEQIQVLVRSEGLSCNLYGPYGPAQCYRLMFNAREVYLALHDVSQFMMLRKWERLQIAFGDRERIIDYQTAHAELGDLLMEGKLTKGAIAKRISVKYNISYHTTHSWAYRGHKARGPQTVGRNSE